MGKLYDAVMKIDEIVARQGLDPLKTKGRIGMDVGFVLGFVGPGDPDDEEKLASLSQVCLTVLGEDCVER